MNTAKFIQEVETQNAPIAAEAILTDEDLERGGLIKVEAFIRTKTSAAAARKARQRENQEAAGLKQINVTAPSDVQEKIKAIAKACSAGQSFEVAVQSVTSHGLVTKNTEMLNCAAIGKRVLALTGWKRQIAKWLGLF